MSDYEIDNELAKAQNFNELLAKSALNDEEKTNTMQQCQSMRTFSTMTI